MRKNGFVVLALLAVLAMFCAPRAYATAELKLSDGVNSVDLLDNGAIICVGAVTCSADSNPLADVVTYVGTIGTWTLNVSTGASHGALGNTSLDLNSINSTSAASTLTISFSDDGFTTSPGPYDFAVGGTLSAPGTLTFQAFAGATKFALTNQVGSDLVFSSPGAFAGTTSGLAAGSALTEVAVLAFTAAGGTSFDAALAPVPEPASVALLGGIVLFAVNTLRRKARRA